MNKKLYVILTVLVVTLVIFGGVVAYNNSDKNSNNESIDNLVVGLDDSFPPYGFRDENNEIVGLDVDLARAVANELNMNVSFQPISWASKEQELNSGNISCIWNGFAYSLERADVMLLSKSYLKGDMYFMLREDSTISSQDELVGKKIGVQSGSVQEADLEASFLGKSAQIIPYSDFLGACMDLEVGGIDAVYSANIYGNYIIEKNNKEYKTIPSTGISKAEGTVIAFKKGNEELMEKIETAFIKLQKEGVIDDISMKWLGDRLVYMEE